jgi:hypothetical protein
MRPIVGIVCLGLAVTLLTMAPHAASALPAKALVTQELGGSSAVTEAGKKRRYSRRAYRRSYQRPRYGSYGRGYGRSYAFGPRRPYTYDYYYYPQYRWSYQQPGFSLYLPY